MSNRFVRAFVGVLGAVALATFGSPAQAVFVSSSFDPLFFDGTGLFSFDDSCMTPGLHIGIFCHAELLSAQIDITDPVTHDTGHVNFAPVLPSHLIIDFVVNAQGNVVALDTLPIGFSFADPSTCGPSVCNDPWWIQWFGRPTSVILYTGSCDEEDDSSSLQNHSRGPDCDINLRSPQSVADHVTFERVPEPATLSLLVIAGMGIPWFVRRRRSS